MSRQRYLQEADKIIDIVQKLCTPTGRVLCKRSVARHLEAFTKGEIRREQRGQVPAPNRAPRRVR